MTHYILQARIPFSGYCYKIAINDKITQSSAVWCNTIPALLKEALLPVTSNYLLSDFKNFYQYTVVVESHFPITASTHPELLL